MNARATLENGEALNLDKGFASFLPVLVRVMSLTSGAVLELGTGIYSTPFLHWACYPKKRELISYENNEQFFRAFQDYQEDFHKVFLADKFLPPERHFDVVFIDHFPQADRMVQLERFVKSANYVIVHDVAPEDFVGVSKYRFDYPAEPRTSVFSNFLDVSALEI